LSAIGLIPLFPKGTKMIVETELVTEIVILEFAERGEYVPPAKAYWVHIDGEKIKIETPDPTGDMLLKAAGKRPCAFELIVEYVHHENEVVEPSETINLHKHGLKGFITAHKEIVSIFIDGKPFSIERGERSVTEILTKVGQASSGYDLYDDKTGLPLPSDAPVKVNGCEEFVTQVRGGASS
jgi:hypothetical protein